MQPAEKINIYHFINYNRSDLASYVNSLRDFNLTVCFDLEDSIQDLFHPEKNSDLKKQGRAFVKEIFQSKLCSQFSDINIGIRLNSFQSGEIDFDFKFLKELSEHVKINSLLLPKTENTEEVKSVLQSLKNSSVEIEEIIPIIETRKGFENLKSILENKNGKMKRIAFGHCDYNFDSNIFPFLHQSSAEYWDWIKEFAQLTKSTGVEFINSPFLKLNDDFSFNSMLEKLCHHCGNSFGQITLTYRQAELCKNFKYNTAHLNGFEKNLAGEKIPSYAEKIIKDFESNNNSKGFSISERTLISPHEYVSAKKYLSSEGD